MSSKIQTETNPLQNIVYFGLYSFGGVSMLSYFAYKGFHQAAHKVKIDRSAGQRLNLSQMGSLSGLKKAIFATGIYLVGFVYLAWNLNLNDRLFQSCIKKDADYTSKIKLDPYFQDFYIINTMRYFGISDKLIKKTQQELKQKIKQNEGKEVKQGTLVHFQKSMLALAQYIGGEHKKIN